MSSVDRIEPEGERKQVTVLFADVQGSMDLAEGRDPEQWREIVQGFFSILAEEVRRFEGTVDKFTGDGIMAVFGAPVAHEDHARRACYAALRMLEEIAGYAADLRREHGLNFSARIGINSGEVIAGAIRCPGSAPRRASGPCARSSASWSMPRGDATRWRSWSRTCTGSTRAARRCWASC